MSEIKRFEGVAPYLDAKSAERAVSPEFAGKASLTWHAKQIQNALAAISEQAGNRAMTDDQRSDIFAQAAGACNALIAAAEGCTDAVMEMAKRHGFDVSALTSADELEKFKADSDATIAELRKALDMAKAENAELQARLDEARKQVEKPGPTVDNAAVDPKQPKAGK